MTLTPPATPVSPNPVVPASVATPEQIEAAKQAEARLEALSALGDVNQANAATGLYGDSGVGKSSLCATAAEYCWKRFHKITCYVSADLGGFGNKLLRLIRLGIVRVYNPTNHIEPFETMEDLSRGYWPEAVEDTMTGYSPPDMQLAAPQVTLWVVTCPKDHQVAALKAKAALNGFSRQCPVCKIIVTPNNWMRVEEITTRSPFHQHVGLWIYDSATALEDWSMQDMADRAARNMDMGGTDDKNALTKTGGRVVSGKYAFGTNQPAHYGFAQNRMQGWIKNARSIPGIVVPPIFTFLELRASDDTGRGNMPIYGPKIAGSAKTSDVPAWLGNCLHIAREQNQRGDMEHRIWLVNHIDPGGLAPHLAKTRAEPGSLPPFLADDKDDPPFTKFSLGYFFDRLEQVLHVGSAQDAQDFPDAPLFMPLAATEPVVVNRKVLGDRDVATGQQGRVTITGAPVGRPAPPAGGVAAAAPVASAPRPPAFANMKPVAPPAQPVAAAPAPPPVAVTPPAAAVTPPVVAVTTPAPAQPAAATQPTPAPRPAVIAGLRTPQRPPVAAQTQPTVAAPAKPAVAAPVAQPVPHPAAPALASQQASQPASQPAASPVSQQQSNVAPAQPVAGAPASTAVRRPTVPVMNRPIGKPPSPPPPGQPPNKAK